MNMKWKLIAAGGTIAALGAGAVAVSAASPPAAAGKQTPAQIFVDKLAGVLHLSSSQAAADAIKQAQLQTVDQMLKDGTITQAQADEMKTRINSGKGIGPGIVPHAREGGHERGKLMRDVAQAALDATVKDLKTTPDGLRAALRSGKTIADLEAAAGVTDAKLRADARDAAKKVLDAAVKAGTITQAQEDQALKMADSIKTPFFFGGPGWQHQEGGENEQPPAPGKPGAPGSPAAPASFTD
jgi:hypothetical protein